MKQNQAYDTKATEMTDEQARQTFDSVAQAEMGISGDEFLRRWERGDYNDVDKDSVPGLVDVWMVLPLVR